jgi:hypothetical protein
MDSSTHWESEYKYKILVGNLRTKWEDDIPVDLQEDGLGKCGLTWIMNRVELHKTNCCGKFEGEPPTMKRVGSDINTCSVTVYSLLVISLLTPLLNGSHVTRACTSSLF